MLSTTADEQTLLYFGMNGEEEALIRPRRILGIPTRARDLPPTTMDSGAEKTAWEIYNERADIADKELIRDWNESLNTLLIFVRR